MAETLSLMEFLQALLGDAHLRGEFGDDPQGTLAAHGLADLSPADVHDALVLVQDNQTVDYSLDHSLDAAITAPPPPPPAGADHEAAVEYLSRYLADPYRAEHWTDVDPDAGTGPTAATGGAQPGAFGTGDDAGYGAGAGSAGDDFAWDPFPEGGGSDAEPDPGGYPGADAHDYADLTDLTEFGEFADLPGAELAQDADGPDPDGAGAALPDEA